MLSADVTTTAPVRAFFCGLSNDLAVELMPPLSAICSFTSDDAGGATDAQIIFCGADTELVGHLRETSPNAAIVVVSRHPEVSCWLDSFEAGATDYCTAPFEAAQMKWIVDSSVRFAPERH